MLRATQKLLAVGARVFARVQPALLLPIQTYVAGRYLLPLAQLADAMGIAVHYTLSPKLARSAAGPRLRAAFAAHAREVGEAFAHGHRWQLIVVADHGHFRPLLLTGSPVAHIGHGNPSKLADDADRLPWEYSRAPRRRDGTLGYAEMIEASTCVRDALVATEPALAGRIHVLGRLLDDVLLADATHRDAGRDALGLSAGTPVLMVASTIRARSLFGMYWEPLLAQLRTLADRYQIVLCPHPNEDAAWRQRLGDDPVLRLLPADVAAGKVLAVADLVLTDFSSLCQKAALLDVPMVFGRCEPLPVWSEGATARLYAHWPTWHPGTALDTCLQRAEVMRGDPAGQAIKAWVNTCPGQACALHRAWLARHFPRRDDRVD
jgi:hypothetical protein